jgi:spectinomycin phosphotransferase
MLSKPDLPDELIHDLLRERFGLQAPAATFLPLGADPSSAVYRVEAAGGAFLLKLRRGPFNELTALVTAALRAQGAADIVAPLATVDGTRWAQAHGCTWLLYPFFAGENGFRAAMSPAQWARLGATVRAVHDAALPPDLAARLPRETFGPRSRDAVRAFQARVARERFDDPTAAAFAALWRERRDEIAQIVAGAERLAAALQRRDAPLVPCHADLHAGNVLVGPGDTLAVVDWDELLLAPRERDLMFVGAGVGAVWNRPEEADWFRSGYGAIAIDPVGVAYYRYERIVADLAAYGAEIFELQSSAEDRAQGLREVTAQFRPGGVIPIAHASYAALTAA